MKIFSVHDSKAEAYLAPIYFRTKGEAIRAFETTCQDETSQFHKYPSDFTLVELGEFNETTSAITPLIAPLHLSHASEYKKSPWLKSMINPEMLNPSESSN